MSVPVFRDGSTKVGVIDRGCRIQGVSDSASVRPQCGIETSGAQDEQRIHGELATD